MMDFYLNISKCPFLLKFPDLFVSYQKEEMAWRKRVQTLPFYWHDSSVPPTTTTLPTPYQVSLIACKNTSIRRSKREEKKRRRLSSCCHRSGGSDNPPLPTHTHRYEKGTDMLSIKKIDPFSSVVFFGEVQRSKASKTKASAFWVKSAHFSVLTFQQVLYLFSPLLLEGSQFLFNLQSPNTMTVI